jgi:hypothetical protein
VNLQNEIIGFFHENPWLWGGPTAAENSSGRRPLLMTCAEAVVTKPFRYRRSALCGSAESARNLAVTLVP